MSQPAWTTARDPHPPPRELWEEPELRAALRAQDLARVFASLKRLGYSQHAIGALTRQSQPEISAVVHGRKILTYATLSRIADGLGIPRGYLGLSWCEHDCPPGSPPPRQR